MWHYQQNRQHLNVSGIVSWGTQSCSSREARETPVVPALRQPPTKRQSATTTVRVKYKLSVTNIATYHYHPPGSTNDTLQPPPSQPFIPPDPTHPARFHAAAHHVLLHTMCSRLTRSCPEVGGRPLFGACEVSLVRVALGTAKLQSTVSSTAASRSTTPGRKECLAPPGRTTFVRKGAFVRFGRLPGLCIYKRNVLLGGLHSAASRTLRAPFVAPVASELRSPCYLDVDGDAGHAFSS